MRYSIAAIPTTYKDIRFRSRLEARWACMFDLLQWQWMYEPVEFKGWIVDFTLFFVKTVYVEVKPFTAHEQFVPQAERLSPYVPGDDILILGARLFDSACLDTVSIGWLGSRDIGDGRNWGEAVLYLCSTCFEVSVTNSLYRWRCLKNGCELRDGEPLAVPPEMTAIAQSFFAHAGNVTQWKRPA